MTNPYPVVRVLFDNSIAVVRGVRILRIMLENQGYCFVNCNDVVRRLTEEDGRWVLEPEPESITEPELPGNSNTPLKRIIRVRRRL